MESPSRLSGHLRSSRDRLTGTWPGRVVLRTIAGAGRLEVFDRAMAVAAQLFTSVFPILIMLSAWTGRQHSQWIADATDMPDETRQVLDQALTQPGASAFGVLGALVVLVSATSLARVLTRAMATVWELPRPRPDLHSVWRWVAVVLTLALSGIVVHTISGYLADIPPRRTWSMLVPFTIDIGIMVLVPWLLLAGQVHARRLVPGGVAYALVMLVIRPVSGALMPRLLEDSADRYGTIGVSFTYITWLYVVAFVTLACALLGQAIAVDEGRFGALVRGHRVDTAQVDTAQLGGSAG